MAHDSKNIKLLMSFALIMDFNLPMHNLENHAYYQGSDLESRGYVISHAWVGNELILALHDKELRHTFWNRLEESDFTIGQLDYKCFYKLIRSNCNYL